jgi:phospholipase C
MLKVIGSLLLLVCSLLFVGCGGGSSTTSSAQPAPTPTPAPPPPPVPTNATLQNSVNHIIIMAQENRSFDHYFGHLMQYWQQNGFPQATNGTTLDGMPATASNVGDPANPGDTPPVINAFQLNTMCVENPSPSWNESHVDFNKGNSISTTFVGDGFAQTAGHESSAANPLHDVIGARAMGYYTGDALNYYYFMASNFATSDRWFSPALSRTQINRMYLLSGTSAGHVYPLAAPFGPLTNKPIVQVLDEHGITWKDYVHPAAAPAGQTPCTSAACLMGQSYLNMFAYQTTILKSEPQNIQPVDQFTADANAGTLPQVVIIEPASEEGLDEHPSDFETNPPDVQVGAKFVAGLINNLMASPSWHDSIFLLTWDEFGGFYDHVSPQPTVSPDGIAPLDLRPGDVCNHSGTVDPSPTCNFQFTGYRLPLIVISPFTKKNFVSHTAADYTAMLKLIETRFGFPGLTARDSEQMDMTEFFDFNAVPWKVPPSPPPQNTSGACYLDHLP